MGKDGKVKNTIMMVKQNMKDNIYMEKEMEKEKIMIIMVNQILKENI